MATVSVSYLWIALKVRGPQERAAGEAIFFAQRAREVRPCPAVLLKRLGSLTGCSPEPHGVYAHRLCIASTNLLFTVEP